MILEDNLVTLIYSQAPQTVNANGTQLVDSLWKKGTCQTANARSYSGAMKGHLFNNDKQGLTGKWFEVPKAKELADELPAFERRKMLKRDADIRIERNQQQSRQERYAQRHSRSKDAS